MSVGELGQGCVLSFLPAQVPLGLRAATRLLPIAWSTAEGRFSPQEWRCGKREGSLQSQKPCTMKTRTFWFPEKSEKETSSATTYTSRIKLLRAEEKFSLYGWEIIVGVAAWILNVFPFRHFSKLQIRVQDLECHQRLQILSSTKINLLIIISFKLLFSFLDYSCFLNFCSIFFCLLKEKEN